MFETLAEGRTEKTFAYMRSTRSPGKSQGKNPTTLAWRKPWYKTLGHILSSNTQSSTLYLPGSLQRYISQATEAYILSASDLGLTTFEHNGSQHSTLLNGVTQSSTHITEVADTRFDQQHVTISARNIWYTPRAEFKINHQSSRRIRV